MERLKGERERRESLLVLPEVLLLSVSLMNGRALSLLAWRGGDPVCIVTTHQPLCHNHFPRA